MSGELEAGFDKEKLIASFNAAAEGYQDVSVLQDKVGEGLLERLELMRISPGILLDLGSGPGKLARKLKQRYRAARIVQMDIAENMLRTSRRSSFRVFSRQSYLCADAENIPLAENTVDMVFSNLMLQWSRDPGLLFEEVLKVLKPEGLYVFSTLGPDTLRELRESWAAADDQGHVNAFMDMHDLGDALIRTGFADPVMEVETLTLTYETVAGLMADLKGLGAHYISSARRKTLTGKKRLLKMQSEYEKRRRDGRLPATYEVIYGHAWAPRTAAKKTAGEGVFTVPLESLKRSLEKRS